MPTANHAFDATCGGCTRTLTGRRLMPPPAHLKNADHTAWAIRDAAEWADVVHVNDVIALPLTRFLDVPVVLTMHHPHEPVLSAMYERYPHVQYVAISDAQARREPMAQIAVVHHGLRLDDYIFKEHKEDYLAFLGRMVPCKGAHAAIAVARRAGLRLKLAGEVQPIYEQVLARAGAAAHRRGSDSISSARPMRS